MSRKATNLIEKHKEQLLAIFNLNNDKVTRRSNYKSIQDILAQVSIEIGYDFEDAEKYFIPNSPYVDPTINMK